MGITSPGENFESLPFGIFDQLEASISQKLNLGFFRKYLCDSINSHLCLSTQLEKEGYRVALIDNVHSDIARYLSDINVFFEIDQVMAFIYFLAEWQKLCGGTGGPSQKVWTRTNILSPNTRYFVAN